jgi:putative secretion ATPase (PEP-CTERM system associated)
MYESYYHLTGKPFQLSPDPTFYYESRVHKRAYAYLEYGLYQGEGFIVITGEVGAGKTTIVRNLLAHLDPTKVVAAHLVSTMLDADDLVRAVCAAFGVPTKGIDKGSMLSDLEHFLRRIALDRKRALIIVDEAQNLTPRAIEELRMLSNFQIGERALLQSFLVGQPELRRIMQGADMQQLRQRVIASYHLGPLDRQETRSYIEHRLRHVGWSGDPKIEEDAYEAIFAFTAGIPRRINLVCNRLLLAGFLGEMHVLGATDVEMVAEEIKSELGVVNQDAESERAEAEAAMAGGQGRLAATAGAPAPKPESGRRSGTALAPEDMAERMERLEKTLAMVLRMLRRIVRAVDPVARHEDEREKEAV